MRRNERLPGSWLEKNKTNKRSEKREMVGGGDSVQRHDPKSPVVVDTVRSTTTGSPIGVWHEATGGLDSFAMLECLAPASLIIDEWGVSRDILSPSPATLRGVDGTPLKILGVWRGAEFAMGHVHVDDDAPTGRFRCDVTVGDNIGSSVPILLGIHFMAATKAVVHCGAGYAVLTSLDSKKVVFGKRPATQLSCGCVQQLYLADKLARVARRQQRGERSAMAAAQTLFSRPASGAPLAGERDFSSDREFAMYLDSLM